MFFFLIMTFITCINLLTTAESEPSIALGVMSATTSFGKLGAGGETESFLLAAWSGGGWEVSGG